jgi:hypothetical protein
LYMKDFERIFGADINFFVSIPYFVLYDRVYPC